MIKDSPAILVSFFYWPLFEPLKNNYLFRDYALDSGAFSSYMSGAAISFNDYVALCKRLRAEDPLCSEIFALDVIGDWKASLKNTEKMWKAGIEAIPCFHEGEPWHVLKSMACDYPKIAIGGCARARLKVKMRFAEQCFSRVWPKPIHGFGFGHEDAVLNLPFQSTDSTNWGFGPQKFGTWKTFGKMSVRGSKQNLRSEIQFYLALERQARHRWHKEIKNVTIRLALSGYALECRARSLEPK
jgi:hypothetical protein